MTLYRSQALSNVTRMAEGPDREPWRKYQNGLWHWFKHARRLLAGKIAMAAKIPDIKSEEQYVALAGEICKRAAEGDAGTEVTIREGGHDIDKQFLIWYGPPGISRGLFLVVNDRGSFGELVTMFPPEDGRSYYEDQAGQPMH